MTWLVFVVVGLAAWRTFHLLALDDITEPLRARLTVEHKALGDWIECPYCFGFWVALAWAVYVAVDAEWAFWTALPFAFSTVVIGIARATSD